MNDATTFELQRRFLLGLAYRMLGSFSEAEDVVQDTWLRWSTIDASGVQKPQAFLVQITTRLCLDRIKSGQRQREQCAGADAFDGRWESMPSAEAALELAQDVSLALTLMWQRLSPLERAVFLLRDVFDWRFDDIAQALGRSRAACWQLAARARVQVKQDTARPFAQNADVQEVQKRRALSDAFAMALRDGNITELAQALVSDLA